MNKQELAIARRVKLLETLQKNPSLRLYMTDLLEEIKNPESLFNARWMHHSGQVDRITVLRLCDAFSVAKKHEERYHLDLSELIEFVSEKTVQILEKDKDIPAEQFKVQIRNFIRQEFPFRNALLKRSARQNMLSYTLYDKDNIKGLIDEQGHYYEGYQGENPEINENIIFTSCVNIISSNLESEFEEKNSKELLKEAFERLSPLEKEVIILRFGFQNGQQSNLAEIGTVLRKSKLKVSRIEQSAQKNKNIYPK